MAIRERVGRTEDAGVNRADRAGGVSASLDTLQKDKSGAWVFRILMLLVPLATASLVVWQARSTNVQEQRSVGPQVTVVQQVGDAITTTTYYSATSGLGVFDPGLSESRPIATAILIFLVGVVIEIALLVWYGSFYLGNPRSRYPLSLPLGSVRVLVIMLVLFSLIIFALLPASWGDNKAVVSLFSLLATIVGFYFGSSQSAQGREGVRTVVTPGAGAQGAGSSGNGASTTGGSSGGASLSVTGISPRSGAPGAALTLSIEGSRFTTEGAEGGRLRIDPPEGIEVGALRFQSPGELTAEVQIAPSAAPTVRRVRLEMAGQIVEGGEFTVIAAP